MNELIINENLLKVIPGKIEFPEYEKLKKDADDLAEGLKSVKVTPETLKTSKKLLAQVNKQIDKVERFRKDAKKEINKPYDELKVKTDSILKSITNATQIIKIQERELEEAEREKKKTDIGIMFIKRRNLYPNFPFKFEDFLSAQGNVLTKSVSMNKTEELMAVWFDSKQKDIDVIKKMDDAEEILAQYIMFPDSVTEAIATIHKKKEYLQKAAEATKKTETPDYNNDVNKVQKPVTFVIYDTEEASKVRSYMIANKIEHKEI